MFRAFFKSLQEHKQRLLAGGIVLGIIAVPIMATIWWNETRTYVELESPNKMLLHLGGWFFNAKRCDLHALHQEWYFEGKQLLVPNDKCVLRLEDRGRAYRVDKDDMTRTELRVVNGEWSPRRDDDTWASIYSYDDF